MKSKQNNATSIRRFFATMPSLFTAIFAKVLCPVCWPAYAGLLSSLGIGISQYIQYLFVLIGIFLIVALATLFYRAKQRRGSGPFIIGLIASFMILVGKFVFQSDHLLYLGIAFLITASLWNSWPKRTNQKSCSTCKDQKTKTLDLTLRYKQ